MTERIVDTACMFPETKRDEYLCGVTCDLVSRYPGLEEIQYIESLVILTQFRKHSRILGHVDRVRFLELCRAVPVNLDGKIPWYSMRSLLRLRDAILFDGGAVYPGKNLNEVRESYPPAETELIALVGKASDVLRDLQAEAEMEDHCD